jgi:hypothetical protein
MELAGEMAIVFFMSFVLVCSVISLASAEWEGHEDEREPRASGAQSRGPQKHLAATSCGKRVRVVETIPAPKHERIARTGKAVVRELEGMEKDEGKKKQKTREGRRLSGSDEPTPSRTRSKGMRRSSSHESLTSAPFEGLRRSSSHESLQLFQSSTPMRPKGMRRSSSHESLTSAPFEGLRRSSSHESLQLLRQHLLSQEKKLQNLTPTRLRDNVSHESLAFTEQGDHFRPRHTSSHESLASACAEGLSRTSSFTPRASSCTSDKSLTSSFDSVGSLSTMRRNNWSSTSLHSIAENSDLNLMGPDEFHLMERQGTYS